MFKRLTVKNFRTLGDVSLELAPYTVIIGQNQAGKSNTLRAMNALFTNATGDDFIRQGQNSCSVELETEEGYIVRWDKTKTSASYTIKKEGEEDRVFTKLAGSVPADVQAVLGIRSVEVDATTVIWPQVHHQGEYAFLIKPHLTAGQAARAIARLTKLDIVVKAQQLCKAAIRRLNNEANEHHSAWVRASQEMEEFKCLEQEKAYLDDIQAGRRALGEDVVRYVEGKQALSQYDLAADAASIELPTVEEVTELRDKLTNLDAIQSLLAILDKTIPSKEIPDVEPLRSELQRLVAGADVYDCLCEKQEELDNMNVASVVMFGEQKQIEKQLAELKGQECPVCGGKI